MSLAYFASHITDHLSRTPEGYLLVEDVPIARTGWQTYKVSELPQDAAADLGLDVSNGHSTVEVYRPAEEVFKPTALASFEGKSICDNHPPGEQFVNPENVGQLELGHLQNVHKGDTALESGDWPVVADFLIKREPLISDVLEGRKREVSGGYEYKLARDGDRLIQTNIIGNHVAVVRKGRAGAEARIQDAALEVEAPKTAAGEGSTGNTQRKEKPPMSWKRIFGLGLQAAAKDEKTTPEELAEAAQSFKEEEKEDEPKPKPSEEKNKDRAPAPPAKDVRTDDGGDRARMHALLDRMLDASDRRADDRRTDDRRADDTDIQELRSLLDEFLAEEEGEAEHQGEGEGELEPVPEAAAEDAVPPFVTDPAGYVHPTRDMPGYKRSKAGEGRKGRSRDSRVIEAEQDTRSADHSEAEDLLRALRPAVARSKDASVRKIYNDELAKYTRSARSSNGSYAAAGRAAVTRAADKAPDPEKRNRSFEAQCEAIRTGVKQEVK